jgi:membrane protease YdiL (CAAX protease family)
MPQPAVGGQEPPQPPGRHLNGAKAILVFLGFLGGQLCAGVLSGIAAGLLFAAGGGRAGDAAGIQSVVEGILPFAMVGGFLLAAAVTALLTWILGRDSFVDRSARGVAWAAGNRMEVLAGLGLGCATGCLYLVFPLFLIPPKPDAPLGPLHEMALSSTLGLFAFLLLALVLAPPIEEFLFRGAMYAGFARSLGTAGSAVLVTGLFVLLHAGEAIFYPPGFIGVALMAICALAVRLATRALGPAVAVHLGYNAVLVLVLVVFESF